MTTGIIFNGEMVRAILDGRKTQTRRVVKLPLNCRSTGCELTPGELSDREVNSVDTLCPYGGPGDHLWVRETWRVFGGREYEYQHHQPSVFYRADCLAFEQEQWRPSIFMPKWASRITLEIVSVRVERVQDIGKDGRQAKDVLAEGITPEQIDHWAKWLHKDDAPAHTFGVLWDSINAKRGFGWATNPWVWVITFKRIN